MTPSTLPAHVAPEDDPEAREQRGGTRATGVAVPEPPRRLGAKCTRTGWTRKRPWIHLAGARLGEWRSKGKGGSPRIPGGGPPTTCYPADRAGERAGARATWRPPARGGRGAGPPFPRGESRITPVQGVTFVFDLLASCWGGDGELERSDRPRSGPGCPGMTAYPRSGTRLPPSRLAGARAPRPSPPARAGDRRPPRRARKPDEVFEPCSPASPPSEGTSQAWTPPRDRTLLPRPRPAR